MAAAWRRPIPPKCLMGIIYRRTPPTSNRESRELVIMISKMSHETHSLIANFNFAKLTAARHGGSVADASAHPLMV